MSKDIIPERFRQKIKEAKEKQLEELDLSYSSNTSESENKLLNFLSNLFSDRAKPLTKIPEEVFELKKIKTLNLSGNRIDELPESIGNLSNLTELDLRRNPLDIPPIEVANQGIKAIKEYFRQLNEEGKDYIYEAKLLIVGEAGAGKTTLAKKIENPEYQLRDEKSTEGIDVIQWKFPMDNSRDFRVNIWDFGGQAIYHATHQFFLTKRSLYTLVADSRKEDTDFYYWLNIVEQLSNNSPLLIIKNEKQDRQREIHERALRGQFTNLKETLATNLKTNRGLDKILAKIRSYIQNLPQIGQVLPKTWVKVRQALENEPRNYISKREIRIRVVGNNQRNFMTIVTHEIDKINDSYKRLNYQKLIPCNCEACKNSQNPYAYELNQLLERLANKKFTIECGKPPSFNEVQVLGLIDNAIDIKQLIPKDNKDINKSIQFKGDIQQLVFLLAENGDISGDFSELMRNITIDKSNYNEHIAGNYIDKSRSVNISGNATVNASGAGALSLGDINAFPRWCCEENSQESNENASRNGCYVAS